MTEKRFHPFAVLHLLRKTILVYLLPLVQVLFARNWAALWAALAQDVLLLALLSMVCWEVLHASGWQMDAHGNLLVRWRLGIRLDRTLRADMLAALPQCCCGPAFRCSFPSNCNVRRRRGG